MASGTGRGRAGSGHRVGWMLLALSIACGTGDEDPQATATTAAADTGSSGAGDDAPTSGGDDDAAVDESDEAGDDADTDGDDDTGSIPACANPSVDLPEGAPALVPGQWIEISPPNVPFDADATALTQGMTLDPCNPATIYVCVAHEQAGLYRSTDAGSTWTELGDFKSPIRVRVDPTDPLHIYVGDGVGGGANGFFVTHDGGETWEIPQSFHDWVATGGGTYDVYDVTPDPTDFEHVLVAFHSPWDNGDAGVLESLDGGNTWTPHVVVQSGSGNDIYMLYDPTLGIGNNQTWLFATQASGHWRTTDGGTTWDQVSEINMEHGGGTKYYAPDGTLYMSASVGILRSDDNGEHLTNIGPNAGYLSVIGDGTNLYVARHFTAQFETAPLSDPTNWTFYNDQIFDEGAFEMGLDSVHGILYAANVRAGVWALKLP